MRSSLHLLLALLAASTFALAGCPPGDDDDSTDDDDAGDDDAGDDDAGDDDAGDDDASAPFSALGHFDDEWGSRHAITEHGWVTWGVGDPSFFTAGQVGDSWMVARNGAGNAFSAGLWSRFEWTGEADAGHYCQVLFDGADEAAALAAGPADASDLAAGCAGFSWTALTPNDTFLAVAGVHVDSWGSTQWITDSVWVSDDSKYDISQFDNAAGFAVGHNGDSNPWNPGLWSRFDYTWSADSWWTCQSTYDAADEAAALAAPGADSTDPASGGCGGVAWTNLTP